MRAVTTARILPRALRAVTGAAGLALATYMLVVASAHAEDDPVPWLGMPGFARGFEGFFDDNGYRTNDDETRQPAQIQTARLEWNCGLYRDLPTFERTEGLITVNNVSLRSTTSFLSSQRTAELSFSLVNRSREAQYPSIQFIVYDTTSPLPALAFSAAPLLDTIEGGTTEQLTASVNMRPGEIESIARFYVRIDR
ncbi:hypothetical protein [Aureimonas jatrophae]|uniref:hypothetical protein n=1 Tax=Aureimonas jatrophae TaxID=1166073 RepID=UPI001606759C|nr:hypothetical protein [Aureimonas jatrophae]MBB3952801.1 hypothetical protein [Aureimonas jatrophae]